MDIDAYRAEAEAFVSAISREHLLHFSGRRESLDLEPIYARHAALFEPAAVERLRAAATGDSGTRALLELAAEGLVGRKTAAETEELARREASATVTAGGRSMSFREAAVVQANERDPERRAAIEEARLELTESRLNPLLRERLDRSHAVVAELGWPCMRVMCEELSGIDLGSLTRQAAEFLGATDAAYEHTVGAEVRVQLGLALERLRRSDLPAFFRAPALDAAFPPERLLPSLRETLHGLGVDLEAQPNVLLDTESRPLKSPRAFCAAVRVPDEVHLVIAPTGGRDDYHALFHEAGHAEHYAHVDRSLAVEHRHLGDNSVTEAFAFLLDHLTADPAWLRVMLGVADPDPVASHARAARLVLLRRYCAKLAYELELHGSEPPLEELPALYSERLSRAVRVAWPAATWLSDVDPFFYAARYLRAWALEARLRGLLRERHGEEWFAEKAAGELLRGLWRSGQRTGAEELLAELDGGRLTLASLIDDFAAA